MQKQAMSSTYFYYADVLFKNFIAAHLFFSSIMFYLFNENFLNFLNLKKLLN